MYISKIILNIAFSSMLCYYTFMNTFFEETLTYNKIFFGYKKGKSLFSGNEIHPYHEILYYLDGDATFVSDKFNHRLTPGSLIIIPRESYHLFAVDNQENYTRFLINFEDFPEISEITNSVMSGIRIIDNVNLHILTIFNRMCEIIKNNSNSAETKISLYGAFLMLLSEINMCSHEPFSPKLRERNHLITRCISYIDNNFKHNINTEIIAKEMNVSSSTLFQTFKKEMGISLHKYIVEKRLIYAHRLIMENQKATNVYLECGYNDYSSFYKAYLKMFRHPPSYHKKFR